VQLDSVTLPVALDSSRYVILPVLGRLSSYFLSIVYACLGVKKAEFTPGSVADLELLTFFAKIIVFLLLIDGNPVRSLSFEFFLARNN